MAFRRQDRYSILWHITNQFEWILCELPYKIHVSIYSTLYKLNSLSVNSKLEDININYIMPFRNHNQTYVKNSQKKSLGVYSKHMACRFQKKHNPKNKQIDRQKLNDEEALNDGPNNHSMMNLTISLKLVKTNVGGWPSQVIHYNLYLLPPNKYFSFCFYTKCLALSTSTLSHLVHGI